MRLSAVIALAVPLLLAACAITPRQQCEAPYRAELRNVEAEITDTRLALRRGFVLVPARFSIGLNYCLRPSGAVYLCTAKDGEPMYDKRPISQRAEQAKLAALIDEAARLKAEIAECRLKFPE